MPTVFHIETHFYGRYGLILNFNEKRSLLKYDYRHCVCRLALVIIPIMNLFRADMKFKTAILAFFSVFSLTAHAIELSECRIGSEDSVNRVKAECGTLQVAENRKNPSRMIDLNIAIVRTDSIKKKNDPVIMLAGGPGQAAVETYPQVASGFRHILKDRDIILVDQRGTGKSNPLKCHFDENLMEQILEDEELYFSELKKCVQAMDADTRFYTTTESIKDLEQVRQALNIEKWNLIGISYGTRKALTYVKMFPDAIRSVILDGVVPQQEALAQHHEQNLQHALSKQFEQCEKQAACKKAFGDVEQQMWQLLEEVEKNPKTIRLQNFMSGEYEDVKITKEYITIAIRMFAYSSSSMNLLPLMIAQANHGQLETIAAQANMIASMMTKSMTNVEMSIVCAEDLPFYRFEEAQGNTLFDKDYLRKTAKSCAVWPHVTVDASFKQAVKSDLPVLLLSGELDPVTPPEFAEKTKQTLSNSRHLIAKGQGHNIFPLGCMPKIIAEFIQEPDKLQEIDTQCMDNFDYTPFFINMMGPKQ